MKTTTEKQMRKTEIEFFVKTRKENNYNGYIGASLIKPFGRYKDTAITNIVVDETGDFVYIYTDNHMTKKPTEKLSKLIKINY
jgi:hypothetical protein